MILLKREVENSLIREFNYVFGDIMNWDNMVQREFKRRWDQIQNDYRET